MKLVKFYLTFALALWFVGSMAGAFLAVVYDDEAMKVIDLVVREGIFCHDLR